MKMIKDIAAFLRLKHWIKNSFVFAPLLFSLEILELTSVLKALLAFLAFSLVSSTIYIINDIHDIKADRMHPKKCKRPIAAGKISAKVAAVIAVLLMLVSLFISWILGDTFLICTASYLVLNFFYTFIGKTVVILDAFCIAIGFVLRVIGGAFAILVPVTGWIIMATFFLTLFMGFGKRRNELLALKENSGGHRKVLDFYTDSLLDKFILSCGTISIISYTLYTLSPAVAERFHTGYNLVFTVPIVTYIIFRYLYIICTKEEGDPTDVVLKEPSLLIAALLWLLTTGGIILLSANGGAQ